MKKFALVVIYLVCSLSAWGISTGTMQCYAGDMDSNLESSIMAALGPVGLGSSAIFAVIENANESRGFHFAMRPLNREERWVIFHRKYSSLSRYYFDHGHSQESETCDYCK